MPAPTQISFAGLPAMAPALARALLGKKPYVAPQGATIEPVELAVRRLRLSQTHLERYRQVCSAPAHPALPPAYLHVVAMPMHMQLFIARQFPVKVLGLIHLRNTIRVLHDIDVRAPLELRVSFDTMRVTDLGQEYDLTTRFAHDGETVWEEVSTMFARSAAPGKEGSKRPSIERSAHPANGVVTQTLDVGGDTGWRYARVSGDYNPIHLTARTAQMFGFKQAVAHGMWSLGRCLAAAAPQLPSGRMQIDTQFKLPVYIPSQALTRTWEVDAGADISMCTPRGDRLHLAMQVRRIA
ncbi:MAG TPA: MaoC/PaaZ C-terminal domain-containing protein [Steroidobacter sp.]|nr:MaoC/PaaZ C-terminal domain-containing protein [Steroidobacter sp.]